MAKIALNYPARSHRVSAANQVMYELKLKGRR